MSKIEGLNSFETDGTVGVLLCSVSTEGSTATWTDPADAYLIWGSFYDEGPTAPNCGESDSSDTSSIFLRELVSSSSLSSTIVTFWPWLSA